MSAFVGLMRTDGRSVSQQELGRLARALPAFDNDRVTSWVRGPVGLVHRLYAITPEDRLECQPWASRDGHLQLVFAGRLDNRNDVAIELALPTATLSETPDGALCLAALQHYGPDALEHLHGSFALALWDDREKRFVLGRDRMGGRPLFYHRNERFIAFATTLNALLALPDIPRALDETILGDLLAQNPFEQHRTLYRGILRVPSASVALCRSGGVTVRSYWEPERRTLGLKRHEDYVEAAREQLERVVTPALRSEKPVAATTSGGLDSSGIAATAARQLAPRKLAVFTRVPPPDFAWPETDQLYFDERSRVLALQRLHPNMDLTLVDDSALHRFDVDPARMFAAMGLFTRNPENLGWFGGLYDRVAATGHRALLSGQSGNFTLGWRGANHFRLRLRAGQLGLLAREAATFRRLTARPAWTVARYDVLGALVPDALRRWRRHRQGRGEGLEHSGFIDPEFSKAHDLTERIRQMGGWRPELRGDSFALRAHWLRRGNEITRDFLGQLPALHGFELRDPLGDPRLIEFCLAVPEEHYFQGGRPRALQRDAIADRVPPEIAGNYKHGLQTPEWFDRLSPQRETILRDVERIAHSPLASSMIDMTRLRRAVAHWPADAIAAEARKMELQHGLWRALNVGRFICWFESGHA